MRSIPQQVMNALQTLSPIEQQEVLDFVEFLKSKHQVNQQEQAEKSEESFLETDKEHRGKSSPLPSPSHILDAIAALPLEGKADAFSGQDHDQILYFKSH
jgi:hypothetical protein